MLKKVAIEAFVVWVLGVLSMIQGVYLILHKDTEVVEDVMGPGRYIILVGLILVILSVVYFLSQYKKSIAGKMQTVHKGITALMGGTVGGTIVALGIYVFALSILGYFFSTLVFFFLILRILKFKSWLFTTALSVALSFFFYITFEYMFHMGFPRGILFH